nr:hypothetical protein [uncultured Clostridium sp.]
MIKGDISGQVMTGTYTYAANLMLDVDGNFKKLYYIWNTKKKFRIINSPLVGDNDNEIKNIDMGRQDRV